MEAVQEYQKSRGDRATLAWTMLRAINTAKKMHNRLPTWLKDADTAWIH